MGPTLVSLLGLLALLLASSVSLTVALKIGAFNIRIFGVKKMQDQDVVDVIIKIIRRYDIILIEEIRDKSGESIRNLLDQVNEGEAQYAMVLSRRLGRTSAKEQFAFLYRSDRNIEVTGQHHWKDPEDLFEREPFAVRFRVPTCETPDFALVGVHLDPDDVEQEIQALVVMETEVKTAWRLDNILFLGDFNADCKYLSSRAKGRLALLNDPRYKWLIADDVDTTVTGTHCAYDRFVLTGRRFADSVKPRSIQVFRFDEEYELSKQMAERVSDHYPIGLELMEDKVIGGCSCVQSLPLLSCVLTVIGTLSLSQTALTL